MPPLSPYKTNNLSHKIQARRAKTSEVSETSEVYVGTCFARAGDHVIGLDVDPRKVDAIKGLSYIEDVPSSVVHDLVASKKATSQ